jgi:hypothetical protein
MKLEPVFLVAPKVSAGSVSTRRAFLFAGAAFVGGAVLGTACGYSLGAATGSAPAPNEPPEPAKTGNNELDELRRLAVSAPIDELVDKHVPFMRLRDRNYQTDSVLWKGVGRLAEEALQNPLLRERRQISALVAASIEQGDPPAALNLKQLLPQLKRLAR